MNYEQELTVEKCYIHPLSLKIYLLQLNLAIEISRTYLYHYDMNILIPCTKNHTVQWS